MDNPKITRERRFGGYPKGVELGDGRASVSVVEVGADEAKQHLESIQVAGSVLETPIHLGVLSCSTSVSVLSLSPSEVAYLLTRRDCFPGDKVLREEEPPPLESRRPLISGYLDGPSPVERRRLQPFHRPNGSTLRWR